MQQDVNKWCGKRVLILGGAGFVGANLVRRLLQESGASITVVDSLDHRFHSTKKSLDSVLGKISFVKGDIRDEALLRKVIPKKDVIFNLAGQTSHPYSIEHPLLDADINSVGPLKVLMAVRDYNPSARVAYTSSSTLVGRSLRDVIDEDHPEQPLDIYSAHKGVAEKYHYIFHNLYNLQTTCLRFANLYGPFGKNNPAYGFLNYFIHLAREGKPITIYGDGEQMRNVMFVEDACDILLTVAGHTGFVGKTFFAVHMDHHSIREIAETIASVFGGMVEYVPWPDARKKMDVGNPHISSERLRDIYDWRPKYSLHDGLCLTKKRMQENS